MSEETTLYCSFCGKSQHKVEKLISSSTACICNECVDLCNDTIEYERTKHKHREMVAGDIGVRITTNAHSPSPASRSRQA